MLEARVGRLEDDMKEVKTELRSIRGDLTALRESVARIEGMLQRTPDATQMWRMAITTWIAGAGGLALVVRLLGS